MNEEITLAAMKLLGVLDFDAACVLLDIEGTTSSIEFVYDVLFPYARENASNYLHDCWDAPSTRDAVETMAIDLGYTEASQWFSEVLKNAREEQPESQKIVLDQLIRLMDEDVKAPGLKKLQGLIWDVGYTNGNLRSHVYADVPVALKAWKAAHKDLRIYSSGSSHAQRVFFANTEYGALVDNFSAFYDTAIGAKRESASYTAIAADALLSPERVLFLSDVPAELDAAKAAGMQVCLVCRPGNQSYSYSPCIENFLQINLR